MAEKEPKSDDQQETQINVTLNQQIDSNTMARTVINSDQSMADQLGETMVSAVPDFDQTGATMETMIEGPTFDGRNQTLGTAMLDRNGDKTKIGPNMGSGERPPESGLKYEIVRSLGKGGFAWVYLVRNVDLDRLEAMKILNTELAEDEDVLDRFVREARTSARFNHQNIVMVYEVQKRGYWNQFKVEPDVLNRHREPFAFFTMSFVEGQTATDLIKKKQRIPQKDAIRIGMDACAALEYAHAKGVVHRDIKPDNILVDRKGMGIVMDFGIAKVADQTRQTAAGTFMGTARYVSPEQAMGREIDARSDLYSMGVALYELSTGRVPFDSDQWMTVLYQHINEAPPAPEKFFGEIDRDLRAIILKMLEKKPEDRFQTAQEVLNALARVYQAMGGEDRRTQALNEIDTRRDLQQAADPAGVTQATTGPPPVRTKTHDVREAPKTAPAPVAKSGSKAPLIVVVLLALGAIGGYLFMRPNKAEAPPPDQNPPPVITMGQLMLSAFPTGELEQITDEQGKQVPVANKSLPQVLELPQGSYKVLFSYQGDTKEVAGHVIDKQTRAHAEFQLNLEELLLEDMK